MILGTPETILTDYKSYRRIGEAKIMTILFQLVLAFFVILSFVLVVAVPVALASPQNWDESRRVILLGSGVWAGLVIVLGVLNFLVV